MEDRIYDYWVATLQDGYFGNIVEVTNNAGGAKALYERFADGNVGKCNELMLTDKKKEYIAKRWKQIDELERDYYKMMEDEICYVNYNERDFPPRLRNIPSPPYGLFIKGSLPNPDKKSVAIVGARECSEYGRVCAEYFGDRLARHGIQVISGMAWGIDGIGQMAAIKANGKCFAVLGCGVDVIYPKNNYRLYELLCENGNGIISEYAPNTPAISRGFPPRNRIISGLCDVLLVVEAKAKSGTLITVNMAVEQGRSVMAIPGRITDELSHGCLSLIREGAAPALSVDSVLDELNQSKEDYVQMKLNLSSENVGIADGREKNREKNESELLDEKEKTIFKELSFDPVSADFLSDKTHLEINEVLITLSKLDLKGYVREIADGKYVKG